MADIKPSALIAKFLYALDNKWGYILGQWHALWTQATLNLKINYIKSKYGDGWKANSSAKKDKYYYAALYGAKWIGHWVTDCSGLFYWAFKELGGYMYHGSNTMWNKYCVAKGKLSSGKRTDGNELKPGTAVFVLKGTSDRSHVGLYIGDGKVIEASGTLAGVCYSNVSDKKWAEWGELKGVDYNNTDTTPHTESEQTSTVGSAVVNAVKVALRSGPSTTSSVLTRVDKGERVLVLGEDWIKVTYLGKTGYMMSKFLDM